MMPNLLALFILGLSGLVIQTQGLSPCITTCKGLDNGDYQSCQGCNVYATCNDGFLYDNRMCPDNQVWDDNRKKCEHTSETCGKCGECINECNDGHADGFYQYCKSCSQYITCARGQTFTFTCPEGLIWNDDRKMCDATSSTCGPGCEEPVAPQPCNCIKNCMGLTDGNYQSCHNCHVYATCASGIMYDRRECQEGLYWDDVLKRCERTSTTCKEDCDIDEPKCNCVNDCDGSQDGDYQSCQGCNMFVSCKQGMTFDKQKCPAGLVWDDFKKRCQYDSNTCGEECEAPGGPPDLCECIEDCDGRPDGKYQSCKGCTMYEECKDMQMINKMCPTGQVWDDEQKKCQYVSMTCAPQCQPEIRPCNCIRSCENLANGDYQSCRGCNVYATCKKNEIEDGKLCPTGQFWDDHMKTCDEVSQTCDEKCNNSPTVPPPASTKPPASTNPPATTQPPTTTTQAPTTTTTTQAPTTTTTTQAPTTTTTTQAPTTTTTTQAPTTTTTTQAPTTTTTTQAPTTTTTTQAPTTTTTTQAPTTTTTTQAPTTTTTTQAPTTTTTTQAPTTTTTTQAPTTTTTTQAPTTTTTTQAPTTTTTTQAPTTTTTTQAPTTTTTTQAPTTTTTTQAPTTTTTTQAPTTTTTKAPTTTTQPPTTTTKQPVTTQQPTTLLPTTTVAPTPPDDSSSSESSESSDSSSSESSDTESSSESKSKSKSKGKSKSSSESKSKSKYKSSSESKSKGKSKSRSSESKSKSKYKSSSESKSKGKSKSSSSESKSKSKYKSSSSESKSKGKGKRTFLESRERRLLQRLQHFLEEQIE